MSPAIRTKRERREKRVNPVTRLAYDVDEAAALIDCSRRKLYSMIGDGTLPSVKIGKLRRIAHDDLMQLIRKGAA
jgi:excisionase family DNA binding protein